MQLSGSSPKHCGGIEINAHMVSCELGSRSFGKIERIAKFGTRVFRKSYRGTCLVVAVEFLDGPFPTVTFVRDEALQHRERGRFTGRCRRVFDQTGKRRYSIEVCFLGQVSADLAIRIHTSFQAAKQLKNECVSKENRRIALLRRAAPHLQWCLRESQYLLKSLAAHALDLAMVRGNFSGILDQREQLLARLVVKHSIVQLATDALRYDGGNPRVGGHSVQFFSGLPKRHRERQLIG